MDKNHSATPSASSATARLFRSYVRYCGGHDEDALFDLLAALHSFGDRISALGRPNMSASADFLALRALRNHFHHKGEVAHQMRRLSMAEVPGLRSDLLFACIVPASTVELALDRMRKEECDAAWGVIRRYGTTVDIEPNIFNVMVDAYELAVWRNAGSGEEAFAVFEAQYDFETENGHEHRVSGTIHARASNVELVLAALLGMSTDKRTPA